MIKCIIYWPYTSPQRFRRFDLILLKLLKISNGIILIYDITNLESFKLIKDFNEELNENGLSNLKKVLVGNKCDLEDKRQVTIEEGKKLAKELGINIIFLINISHLISN